MKVIIIGQLSIRNYHLDEYLVKSGYIFLGYYASITEALNQSITGTDLILMDVSVPENNPEIPAAQISEKLGIPVLFLKTSDDICKDDKIDDAIFLPIDLLNFNTIILQTAPCLPCQREVAPQRRRDSCLFRLLSFNYPVGARQAPPPPIRKPQPQK